MKFDEMDEKWVLEEIEKIKYSYKLRDVIRYSLKRNEAAELKTQSVAEHVYNMLILAYYFCEMEDPEKKLDFEKIMRMILMHDMGEIETGDIQMHNKNKTHQENETFALQKVANSSPHFVSREIESLCAEYNTAQTPEAKFVKAIDKIEQQFWHSVYCNQNMILATCTLEERDKNELKRRDIYKKCGYKIIEKFSQVIHKQMCRKCPEYSNLD